MITYQQKLIKKIKTSRATRRRVTCRPRQKIHKKTNKKQLTQLKRPIDPN